MKTEQVNDDKAYADNGNIWEGWMRFDGIACNEAFDVGYDSTESGHACTYKHPALVQAFKDGVKQYKQEN
jgi:hypothetical protein